MSRKLKIKKISIKQKIPKRQRTPPSIKIRIGNHMLQTQRAITLIKIKIWFQKMARQNRAPTSPTTIQRVK